MQVSLAACHPGEADMSGRLAAPGPGGLLLAGLTGAATSDIDYLDGGGGVVAVRHWLIVPASSACVGGFRMTNDAFDRVTGMPAAADVPGAVCRRLSRSRWGLHRRVRAARATLSAESGNTENARARPAATGRAPLAGG